MEILESYLCKIPNPKPVAGLQNAKPAKPNLGNPKLTKMDCLCLKVDLRMVYCPNRRRTVM
jgi:hypothetical protein